MLPLSHPVSLGGQRKAAKDNVYIIQLRRAALSINVYIKSGGASKTGAPSLADEYKQSTMPHSVSPAGRAASAYTVLKAQIRDTSLPPGFTATEPEIALRLGMSRTPVREALLRLASEGLIDLQPRKGLTVLPIRVQDMRDIYQVLMALEPEAAAAIAARGMPSSAFAPLEAATQRMEAAIDAADLAMWADADDAFHLALMSLNGNARMTLILQTLLDQAHRARMATLTARPLPIQSTREHRDILCAMEQGDAVRARSVFQAHRARAAAELLPLIAARGLKGL